MAPFKQDRKVISLTLLTIVQSFSEIRSVSWTQLGFSRVWSEIGFLDSLSLDPTTQIQKMCCEYQRTNTSDTNLTEVSIQVKVLQSLHTTVD